MKVGKAKGTCRWDAAVDALDILKNLRRGVGLAAVRMPSCQSGTRDLSDLTFLTSMIPVRVLECKSNG